MQGQFITTNIVLLYDDINQVMKIREGCLECYRTRKKIMFSSFADLPFNMTW